MKRPDNLFTKIFLDSGSADDTKTIIESIGFLDGQTTNPTYFVKKNPNITQAVENGKRFSENELLSAYKNLAQEISDYLSGTGSVSIEVYADKNTTAADMIKQGKKMWQWIPNAHIKLPIIPAGLEAARVLIDQGMRVNMTLCFSQQQAAAVHAATRGAKKGDVYISPFVSRLDKIGSNGFDLLKNIQQMYSVQDSHVEILAASVHSVYDIAHIIENNIDRITIPFDDFKTWIEKGMPKNTQNLEKKDESNLRPIEYLELDLTKDVETFNIQHELTNKGLETFATDWNAVLSD